MTVVIRVEGLEHFRRAMVNINRAVEKARRQMVLLVLGLEEYQRRYGHVGRVHVWPSRWTGTDGRSPWDHSRVAWRRLLWPSFDCEDCIGLREHGCWCGHQGAIGPNEPPELWRKWLRRLSSW